MRSPTFKLSLAAIVACLWCLAPQPNIGQEPPAKKNAEADAPAAAPEPAASLLPGTEELDQRIAEAQGKDADDLLARAEKCETLKRWHRVVDDLEQVERIDPKSMDYMQRADAKMHLGDYKGALADFQQGALRRNDLAGRQVMYVLALHFSGNSAGALAEMNAAIKASPDEAFNYSIRGLLYRAFGNRDAAIKDHDRSIKLDAELPSAYVERACTHFAFGDYAAAKKDFDQSIQLGSSDAFIYRYYAYFLATCEDETYRDSNRALQLAGVALELDPNDGFALNAKACALALLGEYDVALGAGLRARENREFAMDPELGGGVESKAYLDAWKQGKPLYRKPNKEK
jgi:tetratricopeptide (TPR) repeat protein